VSGEAAVCSGTGRAFKAGVLFKKGRTRLSGSVWHAESGFFNPHSASGGNHPVSNETGLYAGMETRLFTSLLISLAMTATRTPWRTYFQTMPVTFQELLFSWQHQPLSGLTYAFRIRQRCRESYRLSDDPPPGLDSVFMLESESRYRFELTCSHVYSIQGKFRAELVTLENMESWSFSNSTPVRESGWLMFGEMIIRPLRMLDIRTRLIMFHTASYQSRIYTYEPDLPGVMAIPFFYGRGRRVMLRIRLAWKKRCALTVKCAATTHPSQGTGTEPSPGKKEYDAGFQVQLFLPCRSERP
jgi:hypothetical protein